MQYLPTIGLEIHAELKTKSKMFCSCKNDLLEQHPNVNICPICLGHPGTLPVANEEAIKKVIKVGLALHCEIPERSKFDRKNYFYPDLPKGYQISQYDAPLCKNGYLAIKSEIRNPKSETNPNEQNSNFKTIRIQRVHLEEDTGRLVHPTGVDYSLVDFNRAGVPLMELVTEPDITSAQEASAFAQELQIILRYLGASDADMEKGQMRVEVNISLLPNDQFLISNFQSNPNDQIPKKLGTKVEVKNINSFRSVEAVIEYEIRRQTEVLESGGKVVQETRGWNDVEKQTFSQREKESAHDYRYFPEPDLPPLHFTKEEIEKIQAELPELPQGRRKRMLEEYKLSEKEIEIFVQNKDLGEYFEKVVSELGENLAKEKLQKLIHLSANYMITDLMGLLQSASVEGEDFLITPENFAELINSINEGKISSAIAKQVLKEMFAKGGDPSQIIEKRGLAQINDEESIKKIAKEVIEKNPKAVEDFKKGKQNALQFLVGQLMAKTRGKASPELSTQVLYGLLTKRK